MRLLGARAMIEGEPHGHDPEPARQRSVARVLGDPRRTVRAADEQALADLLADLVAQLARSIDTPPNLVFFSRNGQFMRWVFARRGERISSRGIICGLVERS